VPESARACRGVTAGGAGAGRHVPLRAHASRSHTTGLSRRPLTRKRLMRGQVLLPGHGPRAAPQLELRICRRGCLRAHGAHPAAPRHCMEAASSLSFSILSVTPSPVAPLSPLPLLIPMISRVSVHPQPFRLGRCDFRAPFHAADALLSGGLHSHTSPNATLPPLYWRGPARRAAGGLLLPVHPLGLIASLSPGVIASPPPAGGLLLPRLPGAGAHGRGAHAGACTAPPAALAAARAPRRTSPLLYALGGA
jgi:hypothetical protein